MEAYLVPKQALQQTVRQALRHWHKSDLPDVAPLTKLRLYRPLATTTDSTQPQSRIIIRQLLEAGLQILHQQREASAHLLRQRYLDDVGIKELARRLAVSESQFYKLQDEALEQLVEVLLEQEQHLRFEHQLAVEARLEPLAHQKLFGVESLQERLRGVVSEPTKPWLIAIEGLGGIGKTSLADRLAREMAAAGYFYDIAWISARQQSFLPATGLRPATQPALTVETLHDTLLAQLAPAHTLTLSPPEKVVTLQRLLKQQPYLIIIDNLETVADYRALIPALRHLAGPSKFLLTSRHSLRGYADIFCLSVSELSQADTIALLTYEAQSRELTGLAQATPEQLTGIYQVVGGNPLALKLVLGQVHALPLTQILENLRRAHSRKITELYTYIYWQSWKALSDIGRQALLALPVASPRGSTLDHLAAVSGLENGELSQALEELVAFSLVEVGGDLEQRRYSIHRLTETFLLTEVTQWLPH